ncbi:MAG: hypothetical protein ABSF71_14900 [Terriglobia bacterium]|jgi:hypothetical protein
MTRRTNVVFTLGLASLIVSIAEPTAFAQDTIGLGNSKSEMVFQGTGTQVINVVWQNCNSGVCTMEGDATRAADTRSVGTYKFTSASPRAFKLVASSGLGLFAVEQSSAISFSYTSQRGTLAGRAHFTSFLQNQGVVAAHLTGTLEATDGTLASHFAAGPGTLNLTLAVGKIPLSTLVDAAGSIGGTIDTLSSLTPPSPCREASLIPATVHGTPMPGGSIWFNANFSARGIHDGTVLQFQGAFIQFQANGNTYILHVPNAMVTFSSSVSCASTKFDPGTNIWETTVPVSGGDEIFLSGVTFPVPASGLQGGINLVNWSESFGSNTADVSIRWNWAAAVFSSFSTDYNSLGVKPTRGNACLYNNDDPAGTPEKFANLTVGGGRGAASATTPWSETVAAQANCP